MIKELIRINHLTTVVIAVILLLIVGLLVLRKPTIKYTLSPSQTLEFLRESASFISPENARDRLAANDGKTVFIDIRNSIAFDQGHVKDARNIPVRELFSRHNIVYLQKVEQNGQAVMLYGETPQQANGPWMMLRQVGFKNVLIFNGTYPQISRSSSDAITDDKLGLYTEIPVIDTSAIKRFAAPASPAEDETDEHPQPVKKSFIPTKIEPTSGGGC